MTVAATSVGAVRGEAADGVVVFRGVPYAAPPIGPLRWRAPAPVVPWAGERDATAFGPIPPQDISPERLARRGQSMGEDCLSLNIWTPAADGAERPVLVFLHGGGVVMGSASAPLLDGSALARRGDVVVVTVGFRLGALGSLLLPGRVATNVALRDQLQALRWVREEIGAFGGDPSAVTVAGQSSGAVAVACMLAGDAAAGLFDRAILQSGGLERVRSAAAASSVARRFLAALGVDGSVVRSGATSVAAGDTDGSGVRATGALVGADGSEPTPAAIVAAQGMIPTGFVPPEGPWHPCVDGDLVPEHPLVAAQRRPLLPVPVLAGTTAEEWRPFDAGLSDAEVGEDHLRTRARALLGDDALLDEVLDGYRTEHGGADDAACRRAVGSALVTDFHFAAPTAQLVDAHAARGNPVFHYELGWPSPRPGVGAGHDTCLPLVFGTMDAVPGLAGTGAEVERMSEVVQDAWITFVRGGAPWSPTTPDRRTTMRLGPDPAEVVDHRRDLLSLWDGRYPAAG